jgi:drug/metabolite transporter (DMT)-like permease
MNLLKNGYMHLVYYSLFNGFVGVFVKLTHGLDTLSIVFFRALIAAVFIGLIAAVLRQGRTLWLCNWRATLLVGLLQALMTALIMTALRLTSVSNALFLLYTAPVFSLILAHTCLKEQIRQATWVGIGITLLGVFFLVEPANLSLAGDQSLGNLMALGAGIALAAMTVAAKPLSQKASGYYIVFWQYVVIAALTSPFVRIDSLTLAMGNWWQLGGLGII